MWSDESKFEEHNYWVMVMSQFVEVLKFLPHLFEIFYGNVVYFQSLGSQFSNLDRTGQSDRVNREPEWNPVF